MSLEHVTRGQGLEQRPEGVGEAGNGGARGRGFSGTLELDRLEPLLVLLRRMGGDAELRVRTDDGAAGQVRFAAGEIAAGSSFDGLSGAPVMDRLLTLQGGEVEVAVLHPEPPPAQQVDAGPADPALAYPSALAPPWGVAPSAVPPLGAPFAAVLQPSGGLPPVLRRWLWAIAPALAVALWIAAELVGRLSR